MKAPVGTVLSFPPSLPGGPPPTRAGRSTVSSHGRQDPLAQGAGHPGADLSHKKEPPSRAAPTGAGGRRRGPRCVGRPPQRVHVRGGGTPCGESGGGGPVLSWTRPAWRGRSSSTCPPWPLCAAHIGRYTRLGACGRHFEAAAMGVAMAKAGRSMGCPFGDVERDRRAGGGGGVVCCTRPGPVQRTTPRTAAPSPAPRRGRGREPVGDDPSRLPRLLPAGYRGCY